MPNLQLQSSSNQATLCGRLPSACARDTRTTRVFAHPAILVAVAAATAVYLALFLRTNWQIGDEGTFLHGAQRMLEGEIPSRDFFEVMGPGSFLSLAHWFKLLGISWLTSRIVVLVTALGSGLAIYLITTKRWAGPSVFLPAAVYTVMTVPIWPGVNHHFESNLWVLLGVAIAVVGRGFDAARWLMTGLALGMATTIMPQKGILCAAALAFSTLLQRSGDRPWRTTLVPLFSMALGYATVGFSIVGYFWRHNALGDLWYANVVWPATNYHSVNVVGYAFGMLALIDVPLLVGLLPRPIAGISGVAVAVPFVLVALLPGLFAVIVARYVGSKLAGVTVEPPSWTIGLVGAALFLSECHRPDMMHLIYGSPLLMIAVGQHLIGSKSRWLVVSRRVLVGCVALLAAVLAIKGAAPQARVETRRGAVYMREPDRAIQFIHEQVGRGENVFVYPYNPTLYFLADVRNPTRFSILMYYYNTEAQFEEVIRTLAAKRVKYVLHDRIVAAENFKHWFPGYVHPSEEKQVLERYLAGNYRELMVTRRFRILQRIDEAASGATD